MTTSGLTTTEQQVSTQNREETRAPDRFLRPAVNIVEDDAGLVLTAEAYDPKSGRVLEVLTDQPGVQFYTGNFLDGTAHGKGGNNYPVRTGFCLETQHFPDSPNHPKFPTTELKPGGKFQSTTIYRFSAK